MSLKDKYIEAGGRQDDATYGNYFLRGMNTPELESTKTAMLGEELTLSRIMAKCRIVSAHLQLAAPCKTLAYAAKDISVQIDPNVSCYNCGGKGHLMANCTKSKGKKECGYCNKTGHLEHYCYKKKRDLKENKAPEGGGRFLVATVIEEEQEENVEIILKVSDNVLKIPCPSCKPLRHASSENCQKLDFFSICDEFILKDKKTEINIHKVETGNILFQESVTKKICQNGDESSVTKKVCQNGDESSVTKKVGFSQDINFKKVDATLTVNSRIDSHAHKDQQHMEQQDQHM